MLGFGCKITTPDENFSPSQALWQGDETKISSGMSQSHRGDESFEIVQYIDLYPITLNRRPSGEE